MPRSVICECVNCDLPCSKRGDGTILAVQRPLRKRTQFVWPLDLQAAGQERLIMDKGCEILKQAIDRFRAMSVAEYNELFENTQLSYRTFFEACSGEAQPQKTAAGQPNSPAGTPVQDAIADLNFCLQFSGVPQTVRDLIIRARNAVIAQQRLA
jgi:hypothetical protein